MEDQRLEQLIHVLDQGQVPTAGSVEEERYIMLMQGLKIAGNLEPYPDHLFINQLETKLLKGGNPMKKFLQKFQSSPLAWVGGGLVVLFILANTIRLPMQPFGILRNLTDEDAGVMSETGSQGSGMGVSMPSRDIALNRMDTKMMIAPDMIPMPPPYYGGEDDLTNPNRSLVRNGSLGLLVEDVSEAMEETNRYIESIGGFVTNSSVNKYEDRYQGYLSLRVPQQEFAAAVSYLKRLAVEVEAEDISAYDQTGQVTQAEEELSRLRAELIQYEELLRNAASNEERIKLQLQIDRMSREIHNWEQQQEQLQGQEQMSQLSVNFSEKKFELPIVGSLGLESTFAEASLSLKRTIVWLVVLVIWVVVFAPVWIPLWLVLKWWTKKQGLQGK